MIRTLGAGCALLLVVHAVGVRLDWRTRWRRFLAFGILNSAIPFMLISAAEKAMTAAFTVDPGRDGAALRRTDCGRLGG